MIVEYKACTSVLSPCLSCLVFTPCPSSLFFFCHLYNRCCFIARLYLLIELHSVVVVCLVFYPIRFASLLSLYPLRFSLVLCFVVLVYFVVWSLCSTIVVCRCIMIVVCCFGALSLYCCAVFLSWFVGVLRDPFFVLSVCPLLLYCCLSNSLYSLWTKHKKTLSLLFCDRV